MTQRVVSRGTFPPPLPEEWRHMAIEWDVSFHHCPRCGKAYEVGHTFCEEYR
jgi:hypothetical protein